MRNEKGQGFDTFKLLIAAVVAMVILGIVTGVFGQIWNLIAGISCVSNPIGEISSKIQSATTGMIVVTQVLCFTASGESIGADVIKQRVSSSVSTVTWKCERIGDNWASVCDPNTGAITVDEDTNMITAKRDTQFKVKISCPPGDGGAMCTLTVVNPA